MHQSVEELKELSLGIVESQVLTTFSTVTNKVANFETVSPAIVYEYPLNEHIRAWLRLENLFQKLHFLINENASQHSHTCVAALIDILTLLDRPDLKSKLIQEFTRYTNYLNRLESQPNIDASKLKSLQNELQFVASNLQIQSGKIGQNLRENDFLNRIRQHLLTPGGTCGFDIPSYHFWLHQPHESRKNDLLQWIKGLSDIETAVNLLLRLTRQTGSSKKVVANQGYFQTSLEYHANIKLVQVTIPENTYIFPEISAGGNRLCIRLLTVELPERTTVPYPDDLEFQLRLCLL